MIADHPPGALGTRPFLAPVVAGEAILASGDRAIVEAIAPDAYVVSVLGRGSKAARPVVLRPRLLGRDRAEVEVGGRSRLALLCAAPHGLTAGALGLAVDGSLVVHSSVRGEVSRLRRLLGGGIEADPYRLAGEVESDAARVQEHMRRGALLEAATEYHAPLLPHSDAPGVVELREKLDRRVRHAVLSRGDCDTRWAFVDSAAGGDDLVAWKSLLADLPFSRSTMPAEAGPRPRPRGCATPGALAAYRDIDATRPRRGSSGAGRTRAALSLRVALRPARRVLLG